MQRLPLILSATALVVAVFGSTPLGEAAGNTVSTSLRTATQATGIASSRAEPTRRGPRGPRGRRGKRGLRGPVGPIGPEGPVGPQGVPGTAVAYAQIASTGMIGWAKNFAQANVSHPSTGIYCIGGLATRPLNVVASPGTTGDGLSEIVMLGAPSACVPSGLTQATVFMYDINGVLTDNDFMMTIN